MAESLVEQHVARRMMRRTVVLLAALAGLVGSGALLVSAGGAASAVVTLQAITVPASASDPSLPHLTYSGATITLEGVARGAGNQFRWDFGDGSATMAWTAIGDPENLGVTHSYTGSVKDTFTATLSVRESSQPAVVATATYPVEIEAGSDLTDPAQAKVRATMALDASLWYLHVHETRSTLAAGAPGYGQPAGVWQNDYLTDSAEYTQSDTCGTVYAFERHGSLVGGDPNSDPYVEDVQRGLNAILAKATVINNISQGGRLGNPDANGNGFAIQLADNNNFRSALCALAIGASAAGGRIAATGPANVAGRSFAAIGQDLADYFAWGQTSCGACFGNGGWYYGANAITNAQGDTNPLPILALGVLESELGETIPAFVRIQVPDFVNYIHNTATGTHDFGGYGLSLPSDFVTVPDTAGGILAHLFVGDSGHHPDVEHAIGYIYRHWNDTDPSIGYFVNLGDSFTMFLTAEAMTAASPSTGLSLITDYNASAPLPTFDGAYTQPGQTKQGYGNNLVSHLAPDGSLPDSADWTQNGITVHSGDFGFDAGSSGDSFATTALNSRVLEALPLAVGDSVAAPVANAGGPYNGSVNVPIQLDGSASSGTGLTYAWDFHNDGKFADATGATPTVTFAVPGTYSIALRVTDNAGVTNIANTTVTVSAEPPVADAGGPYSARPGETIQLDGSGSTDPQGLVLTYAWDLQGDGLYLDSTLAKPNFTVRAAAAVGTSYTVCLRVSNGAGRNTACTTVTVVAVQQPPICVIVAPNEVRSNTGGTMKFTVDGSNSSDVNGNSLTFSWTTDSGPVFADPLAALTSQTRDMAHAGASVSWTDTLTVNNGIFSSSCDKTITVVDNVPPAFTIKPQNVVFEADANTTANVNAWLANVAATDPAASEGVPVIVSNDFVPNIGIGGVGVGNTELVTWTASDIDDSVTAQTSATVAVVDTTPPTLTLPPNSAGEATGPNGRTVTFSASALDFVSGNVGVTCVPASGSAFPVGTTVVNCSATDGAGNTATGHFNVSVTDTTAPTLNLPSDIEVNSANAAGATVNFTATATDLVDGAVPVTCSPASGATFAVGSTTVNCSATDAHSNTAAGSFKVTVLDPTPPAITPTITGTLGQNGWYTSDVTVHWDVSDPESAISSKSGCGDATRSTDTTSSGVTYTCTATSRGGTSTESVTITRDSKPPTITCNAALFTLNQSPANVTAVAADAGSGPTSQSLSLPANTATFGSKSVTFSASDNVGNTTTQSCPYAVGYGFGGFMSPLPKSTLQKSGSTIPVKFVLTNASGQPILPLAAASLAAANGVEVTLAGPNIVPQTVLCSWNSLFLYFQCNIKVPSSVKTGAANPYTITASENLGAGFVTAPSAGNTVNPETIYFK